MNETTDVTLNIQDVPRLVSRYWGWILTATICSTALFVAASFQIPKKYKTHFVLTITSKYFQSPLIGDFVPELSESNEMVSQRESLIRQVLTPEYLDSLGARYGIYQSQSHKPKVGLDALSDKFKYWTQKNGLTQAASRDSQLSAEREALRARIEINSQNTTTFNVGFIYSDPVVAFKVTSDIYSEIIQSLLEIRMHTLANIRDAIQNRLDSLENNLPVVSEPSLAPSPSVPNDEQVVASELASVRSQIRALTAEYTDEHPLVIQLRQRERILLKRQDSLTGGIPPTETSTHHEKPSVRGGTGEATRDIYEDLSKKLNYLNIAIDSDRQHQGDYFATLEPPQYPVAPLWPKKGLFAVWGFALGFFGSLFVASIKEYFDRSALHADTLAHQLGIPVLGHFPAFPSKATPNT